VSRNKKVLQHIDKNGLGIEVGPSINPIAAKRDGYRVQIIDHLNQTQLRAKYQDHEVDLNQIEDVDFVWKGESYAELTGNPKHYDWIIASHLIEHTPNLIGFLNDCDAILKDDGVISLIVPDKRYCFDRFRPITGLGKIIDSHLQKSVIHSPGTVAEYYLNVVSKSGSIAWGSGAIGKYKTVHSIADAVQGIKPVVKENEFIDVHAWCFVPHSFRLIIHDLYSLGLIPFQEVAFHSTNGLEFYITLGRGGKGIDKSRIEMLKLIDAEIKDRVGMMKLWHFGIYNIKRLVRFFL
tara:strand:+ start:109 stop:987 length:879 start_codon:yes stop_codon:yes gene_type:complete